MKICIHISASISNRLLFFFTVIAFFCSGFQQLNTQNKNTKEIITAFNNYSSPYREVAYCHLNKSTYIKGEMIGFSAYVFDKSLKVPSKITKNLYCVITDESDKVLKSKLLKVNDGFANNVFKVDSLFTSGNYKFKAYTNWMKNFDERNVFVESFKVINPDIEIIDEKLVSENNIDAQFLPEGGHLVDLVKTTVGVILKNTEGFGVANIRGVVYDANGQYLTEFKTNALGIGRFLLIPEINESYTVKISHLNKSFEYVINDVKSKGISINVNNSQGKLALEFSTNTRTLNDIKGKPFKLIIHNGKKTKGIDISFDDVDTVRLIDYDELYSGINIFTLFDDNNRPILERMMFNYNDIKQIKLGNTSYRQLKDSTQISIPILGDFNVAKDTFNISVSALPEKTKSYKRHHDIISYTYLQPYVKGFIENAKYYFENIDSERKYDLDNLLITQGWSSYNWNNIFNNNVSDNFAFEDGILLKANKNVKEQNNFLLYPLKNNDGLVINLSEENNSFLKSGLFPVGDEKLSVGTLNKKGKIGAPGIYAQFFPSKIPEFNNNFEVLNPKELTFTKVTPNTPFTLEDLKETQQLDDVIINATPESIKLKKFQSSSFDVVDVFDDAKRNMNLTFVNYVNAFLPDFVASEGGGQLSLNNRVPFSLLSTDSTPIVYLDDVLISGLEFFIGYFMDNVDYVAVNRRGLGEGFLGANGVIRIYTKKDYKNNRRSNFLKKFEFPLTFAEDKKFYVPKYSLYNDNFFKDYGVIDWVPNTTVDANGNLNFTVYNPANNSFKLFIEGATNKGQFISETKVLNLSNAN